MTLHIFTTSLRAFYRTQPDRHVWRGVKKYFDVTRVNDLTIPLLFLYDAIEQADQNVFPLDHLIHPLDDYPDFLNPGGPEVYFNYLALWVLGQVAEFEGKPMAPAAIAAAENMPPLAALEFAYQQAHYSRCADGPGLTNDRIEMLRRINNRFRKLLVDNCWYDDDEDDYGPLSIIEVDGDLYAYDIEHVCFLNAPPDLTTFEFWFYHRQVVPDEETVRALIQRQNIHEAEDEQTR